MTKSEIDRKLSGAITVQDLIDELSHCDPEAKVVFACDYGDICHTQQALPVSSAESLDPDNLRLATSGYSQSGLAVEEIDEDEYDDDGQPVHDEDWASEVVILR